MFSNFKGSASSKILKIVIIIVLILTLIFVGAYLFLDSMMRKTGDLNQSTETYSADNTQDVTEETGDENKDPIFSQAEDILKDKKVVNFLLIGQDKRAGQDDQRSDSMILCTLNKSTKTLTMTSFLRDMWVYIPGYYNQRLNKTYFLGGSSLLNETLDYNFGVSADYTVEIDFSGFMEAVDLVGGLDIELTKTEAEYLNKRGNWGVETNKDWSLKEGVNHLTGSQTLAYSRIRKIGTDFARTNRQRKVLITLVEKAKTLDVFELYNLITSILPLVNTDLETPQVMGLLVDVLPMLGDLKVVSQRIPTNGQYSYANKNGADVIVLSEKNMKANKKLLEEAMKTK